MTQEFARGATERVSTLNRLAEPLANTYRRNRDGSVIHRADCKRAGCTSSAWPYADGYTADQIHQAVVQHPWLLPCRVCRPHLETS